MSDQEQHHQQVQKALGNQIKNLRRKKEWTQNTLAELAGMTTRRLAEIERGAIDLRLSELITIAQAFNMGLAQLFHGIP